MNLELRIYAELQQVAKQSMGLNSNWEHGGPFAFHETVYCRSSNLNIAVAWNSVLS